MIFDLRLFLRKGKWRRDTAFLAIGAAITASFTLTVFGNSMILSERKDPAELEKCAGGCQGICVSNGNTLWIEGKKPVADIDTPEIREPKRAAEFAFGNGATNRLAALVNKGHLKLQAWPDRDKGRYGRMLRILVRGGKSLGGIMVAEDLSRT